MAGNSDDLLISVSTDLTTIKRQLKQLGQDVSATTSGVSKKFEAMGKGIDQSMTPVQRRINELVGIPVTSKVKEWNGALAMHAAAMDKIGGSVKLTSSQMLNLSRQGNDVITMFAMGANPMQIFASQAGQIYGALEEGPGGLRGSLKALGAQVVGLAVRFPLATAAVAAAGAAFVAYKALGGSSVETLDELLKKHAENIKLLGDAYEQVSGKQQKYAALATVTVNALNQKTADEAKKQIAAAVTTLLDQSAGFGKRGTTSIAEFGDAYAKLAEGLKSGNPDIKEFLRQIDEIANANPKLSASRDIIVEQMKDAAQMAASLPELGKQIGAVEEKFSKLREAINDIDNESAKKALTELQEKFKNGEITIVDVRKALEALEQKNLNLSGIIGPFEKLFEAIDKIKPKQILSDLGTLAPVISGGGQFLNPDQQNTFNAMQARLNEAGGSASAKMLRNFEGFIPKAKWDVNHFRVGFGSDTTTRANGDIEKVTKDTIVTLDDAQRDLSRRIIEFQNGIQGAIGSDTWRSLSEGQQAALTSIAYNYGRLPKAIVAAIQSGGGPEVVAKAIASLSANPKRRHEEAQSYLSGTGISLNEAGLGNKKTPDELFKGDQDAIQRRIDLINAQFEAQQKLNPLIKDYGFQVEQARIYQELLNDAQKRGVEVTPEMKKGLEELAANYATATAARNQLTEAQQLAVQSAQQGSEFGKDLLGGFISDLRSGKTAAEALAGALSKVADKLLDMALNSAFGLGPGGNGTGGPLSFIGTLLGGLFRANGGPVEAGQPYIVGEKRPELFVPNVPGRIVPRVPTANSGGGTGGGNTTVVTINAPINAPGADSAALARVERSVQELGKNIPKMVDARSDARQTRRTRA